MTGYQAATVHNQTITNEEGKRNLRERYPDLSSRLGEVINDDIKTQITELASRAADLGIAIKDSIFLVVEPAGHCHLYIADLDNVEVLPNYNKQQLLRNNLEDASHIMQVKDWLMQK